MYYFDETPIIACSTSAHGRSAIAVIRISGNFELEQFSEILKFSRSGPIEPRKSYLIKIHENDQLIDEALAVFFSAPNSYTGENVLELSVHGNPINVDRIIELFISKYRLRSANPGEFTYRAMKNNKLSLSQVEGLDLLLNASSYFALDSGQNLLRGDLDKEFIQLKEKFLTLKAYLELNIDFAEDIGEERSWSLARSAFQSFNDSLMVLWDRGSIEPKTILSPKIVLFGKANSGKSTLFNSLLKTERSIVSPIAGTTRDYISEFIMIEGVQFELVDTAGLRDTEDFVESQGIARAHELIEKSFYKILLQNVYEIDFSFEKFDADLVIYTHLDVVQDFNLPAGSIGANLLVDDVTKQVIDKLLHKFKDVISKNPIVIPRHRELINSLSDRTTSLKTLFDNEPDIAILSSELNLIEQELYELLGQVTPDRVLKEIFENFCIGK
ncbi:MAG: GTP-binding protein [Halobacteriovoraceae bacterium]|nr:GTP-binding protein [Halobacteriovoraceae bacterium]